mmetsp:Transcript_65615/g.207558  ORF Transcript_65615/g.207558 Transcript_65615/m.207558 type:complete len:241 (+) Transcript_65615:303-1025(+)
MVLRPQLLHGLEVGPEVRPRLPKDAPLDNVHRGGPGVPREDLPAPRDLQAAQHRKLLGAGMHQHPAALRHRQEEPLLSDPVGADEYQDLLPLPPSVLQVGCHGTRGVGCALILFRKGVSRVAVGRVEEERRRVLELLQQRTRFEGLGEAHVPAVHVRGPPGEAEKELHRPRAVVGVHQRHLRSPHLHQLVHREDADVRPPHPQLQRDYVTCDLAAVDRPRVPALREPGVVVRVPVGQEVR